MWIIILLLDHNPGEFIAVTFCAYYCHPLTLLFLYLKTLVEFNELVENEALYRTQFVRI